MTDESEGVERLLSEAIGALCVCVWELGGGMSHRLPPFLPSHHFCIPISSRSIYLLQRVHFASDISKVLVLFCRASSEVYGR